MGIKPRKEVVVNKDTELVSFVGLKCWMKEKWGSFVKNPTEGVRQWLKTRAQVEPVDVFLSASSRTPEKPDMVRVHVRVASVDTTKLLANSGQDGASVWYYSGSYKVIWLPADLDLAAAHRRAALAQGT